MENNLKHGDEDKTQALTFVATANAIKYHRAYPIFLNNKGSSNA